MHIWTYFIIPSQNWYHKIITESHNINLHSCVSTRENLSSGCANNKGANQSAHPRSLISAFVIRLLVRIISKLATSRFPLFYLVSVAEETGLSLAESPKTDFVGPRPKIMYMKCTNQQARNVGATSYSYKYNMLTSTFALFIAYA